MSLSKKPYRGTRDFFPPEKRVLDYMFSVMRRTAESFAYECYDGPLLEEVELYKAKSGEELINDQIYGFTDRGERHVAIRPEMTPTVARMVAQVHREVPKPIRWYAIPNLMRYEKPQKGRLREHWQFNCDIFGADQSLGSLEIFQLAIQLMRNFGADSSQFSILINDREVVDAIFKGVLKLEDSQVYRLYKVIDKAKKVSSEALDKMISEVITDPKKKELFKQYLEIKTFDQLFQYAKDNKVEDSLQEFYKLYTKLQQIKIDEYISYDPTIVRGLDYYTGVVFEIFDKHPENRRAICGGGAYANLLQIFDEKPLPGVGFGLGDVTLLDFLKSHKLLPPSVESPDIDILVSYQVPEAENKALELADDLRTWGLKVESHMGTARPKKVFQLTDKKGHKFATFMGEEELHHDTVELRDLKNKKNQTIELKKIEDIYKIIKGNEHG